MAVFILRSSAAAAQTFDYYIGPSGNDSNPGTQVSPWAITAINSKGATYAGKSIGLLDGTYDLTGISNAGGRQAPQLAVTSGSSGSPTVIKAVNDRLAILKCKTAGGSRVDHPAIGQEAASGGYVTLSGLTIYGTSYCGASFYYTGEQQPGIRVENCEIYDIDRQAIDTDNTPGVWLSGTLGAVVTNCYIHDCKCSGNGHNGCAVETFGTRGTIIEHSTLEACGSGHYSKHSSSHAIPDEGCIFRYNYVLNCVSPLTGYDNADFTGVYDEFQVHHNVIESSTIGVTFPDLGPTYHAQSPIKAYNNTVSLAAASHGCWQWSANTTGATVTFYNNILYRTGTPGYRGDIHVRNFGEILVLDFNCWYTSSTRQWSIGSGDSPTSTYSTLANWRTALGSGTNTHEANSFTTDPSFVGTGSGPVRYKLAGGSPCLGTGKVGGVDGGSSTNLGAYEAGSEQIGANWL